MVPQAWIIKAIIFYALHIFTTVESMFQSDRIVSLPGQPKVNFQQFGGYITVDEKQQRALFYYFVEAETEPSSKPLVLWLNGGPGCSSVGLGAFVEHGPFQPRGNVLVKNHYSWNKEANMLYLDSPAGVGFSYSANKSFYDSVGDDITARDNLVFLQHWFNKFPEYRDRDFFVTGESYAGHYVPQLAQLIIQYKDDFNLKGIAIGNPLLEYQTDFNSRSDFFWSHGLISDATYDQLSSVCNYSQIMLQVETDTLTPICSGVQNQVLSEIGEYIDFYDVTLDVCLSSVLSQSMVLDKMQDSDKVDVCVEKETIDYLNRKDVQEALHARLVGITRWISCTKVFLYERENMGIPIIPVLRSLLKAGIPVLIYSGDQDSVLPLIGTRILVNGLAKALELNTTFPYNAWYERQQVGGWTQVYGDILSYATIRGASHEAPFSQPERSLVLFSAFVKGKQLPLAKGRTRAQSS